MALTTIFNVFTGNFDYIDLTSNPSDINETTATLLNNVNLNNVTGLAFSNSVVRSFEAFVSVSILASSNLFENYKLYGVLTDLGWELAQTAVGDISSIQFSLTTLGQVRYTSANYPGFTSGTFKFRAITLSV